MDSAALALDGVLTGRPARGTKPLQGPAEGAFEAAAGKPGRPVADIAIVICTRDRPNSLDRLLRTVVQQSVLPREVVVVDDGRLGEARLAEWEAQCARAGVRWVYTRKRVPGLTASRNLGVSLCRAGVIQFLDDDLTLSRDFLEQVSAVFCDTAAAGVGGVECSLREPGLAAAGSGWFALGYRIAGWWAVVQRRRVWRRGPLPRGCAERPYLCGAAAYRREVFERHRFDESMAGYGLGEDRQFSLRVAGDWRLVRSQRAVATHHHDPAGRPDWYEIGRQTVANYLYTQTSARPFGFGEAVVTGWTLLCVAGLHGLFSVVGDREMHRARLRGMLDQARAELRRRLLPRAVLEALDEPLPAGPPDARRIAFVITHLHPGGAEWLTVRVAERLHSLGHFPHIWTMKQGGGLVSVAQAAGVPVRVGLQRDKYEPGCALRLARLCKRDQIDTLVAVGSGGDRMFWSVLSRLHHRHQVVVWAHDWPSRLRPTFEWVNRRLYGFVSRFLAVGHRHAAAMARLERVPQDRLRVVCNGVERWCAQDALELRRQEARRALAERICSVAGEQLERGLRDRPDRVAACRLVGVVANLRPVKRLHRFLRMAVQLRRLDEQVLCILIGEGPARAGLEREMASLGGPRPVLLLGRQVDASRLLGGLDVLTLCSRRECLPVSVLEAMSAGTLVVAPLIGSLDEVLIGSGPDATGVVLDTARLDDPAYYAESVHQALQRPDRGQITRRARTLVDERFGIERMVDELLAATALPGPERGAPGTA